MTGQNPFLRHLFIFSFITVTLLLLIRFHSRPLEKGERWLNRERTDTLEDIYRHYAKQLYFFLLKMSGSEQTAEDLVQETFFRATVSLSFKEIEDVRAWLFKVARHAYLDEWRKRKRWQWIPFMEEIMPKNELLSPYGLPEETILSEEVAEDLLTLMTFLPENYRTILYLREYEQFTYAELAETLEMTEAQVKVTLHRARKRLKQLAEKHGWRDNDDRMDER